MSLKLEAVPRPDEKSVLLRFAYTSKTRKYFYTGVVIPKKDFIPDSFEKPVRNSNPNYKHYNNLIGVVYNRIMNITSALRLEQQEPTGQLVSLRFHQKVDGLEITEDLKINKAIDVFLSSKGYDLSTAKLYRSMFKHLLNCFQDFQISQFDLVKWNRFREYLSIDKGLAANTVSIRLTKLKCFLKFFRMKGINFKLVAYPMPKEEIKKISLERDTLKIIRDFYPETESLKRVKDLCLFQCFTGLRISDLKRLNESHIKVDDVDKDLYFISMKSHKTNSQMTIPLTLEAKRILEKYKFQLPMLAEQYYNRELKNLLKQAGVTKKIEWVAFDNHGAKYQKIKPLHEVFSNHACSRTAIGYFMDQGYPLSDITRIVGKSMDTIMKYYYGRTSEADILNRQRAINKRS